MKHLHEQIRPLVELKLSDRIYATQKRRWIGYTQADKVLSKMEELLHHPNAHLMPNLLIIGETNNGKSYLIEKFMKDHPPYEKGNNVIVPVIAIKIPPDANSDTIYSLILDEFKVTYSLAYKKEVKTKLAFDALERMNVKLIIMDDLHVLMNTTKLKKAQLLDTLKYIGKKADIPIIGSGTREAHTAVVSDSQLANRFEPLELPQWKPNSDYRKLLATFEKLFPLKMPSHLQEKRIAMVIYTMSGGTIGGIDTLLKRAAINAIKDGTEVITLQGLQRLMSPSNKDINTEMGYMARVIEHRE